MTAPEETPCTECGAVRHRGELFAVEGKPVCHRCLFGDAAPVEIYPIGVVVNGQQRARRGFGVSHKSRQSRIDLSPGQQRFMHRLEEETHLTVVYYLHQARPVRSRFRRGLDGKTVGVFASRTPDRLSRIGIQDVKLVEVRGTSLVVEGLDAVDGTPVLDLKLCWRHREA